MKVFLALVFGIAVGVAALWYFRAHPENRDLQKAGADIESAARSASADVQEKLRSLDLSSDTIKKEMDETGRVIRQKTQDAGQAIADATADARVTAAIKTKMLRDPDLSVWNVSVNTTGGVVTLSGSVASPELIGRAMMLALETEGARQVVSTLQVKPPNA